MQDASTNKQDASTQDAQDANAAGAQGAQDANAAGTQDAQDVNAAGAQGAQDAGAQGAAGSGTRKVIVIDGNSLMHRAFHAVPPYMRSPDGRPTNACFGFISMLLHIIEAATPDAIICAFDKGVPAFRMEALESYKAQRPPTDPDLKAQFPMIQDLLSAMNIPIVQLQDWEGDDIIGTLGHMGDALGYNSLLVTGDRDAFQLATDLTQIVATKTGVTDIKLYGPAEVQERYGVRPEQVADFIALRGDTSDNIPGLPGVGEKTAAKLLQQYGTLEGIVAHKDELKPKVQQALEENETQVFNGRIVATIRCDVPIDLDLAAVRFPDFAEEPVREVFGELGIRAHIPKILSLISAGDEPISAFEREVKVPPLVAEGEKDAFIARIVAAVPAAGKTASPASASAPHEAETSAAASAAEDAGDIPDDAWVAALIDESGEATLFDDGVRLIVATAEGRAEFPSDRIAPVLAQLVGKVPLVTMDAKALLHAVAPVDSSKEALVEPLDVDLTRLYDVSLAAYLLDSTRSTYAVGQLVERYLKSSLPAEDEDQPASHVAAAALRALRGPMTSALAKDGSLELFRTIEMPLVPVLVQMERTGVCLDVPRLKGFSKAMEDQLETLTGSIYAAAGEEFNISSPKQLGEVLFVKLGLKGTKKTQKGFSTDASVLEKLADEHPLPGLVLEYRELSKLKSTYLDTLPNELKDDHRLHTTFNQTVTATGRLSSSDPNLQNIPVRTDLGREIRTAFIAAPPEAGSRRAGDAANAANAAASAAGHAASNAAADAADAAAWKFVSADYSQIELRLLAHLSGDEGLIEAFAEGRDFHAATASRIFDIPIDELPPEVRRRAKAVNFGIVYGQQAFGLARSLGISFQDAQEMIDRYFAAYPQVRIYLDGLVKDATDTGYAITMFGRKRHVPELHASKPMQREAAKRVAMNHPMQGSAADIIKLAMIEVARRLRTEGFRAELVLQVHDELDFNCPADELERLEKMVEDVMENVVELKVPLVVSCESGENWAVAH